MVLLNHGASQDLSYSLPPVLVLYQGLVTNSVSSIYQGFAEYCAYVSLISTFGGGRSKICFFDTEISVHPIPLYLNANS